MSRPFSSLTAADCGRDIVLDIPNGTEPWPHPAAVAATAYREAGWALRWNAEQPDYLFRSPISGGYNEFPVLPGESDVLAVVTAMIAGDLEPMRTATRHRLALLPDIRDTLAVGSITDDRYYLVGDTPVRVWSDKRGGWNVVTAHGDIATVSGMRTLLLVLRAIRGSR